MRDASASGVCVCRLVVSVVRRRWSGLVWSGWSSVHAARLSSFRFRLAGSTHRLLFTQAASHGLDNR